MNEEILSIHSQNEQENSRRFPQFAARMNEEILSIHNQNEQENSRRFPQFAARINEEILARTTEGISA